MTAERRVELLMGVPATRPPVEVSYEEQRIQDYIKAYQTTGRPPQPVPTTPAGTSERLALGLPPLFQPYVDQITAGAILTLEALPEVQTFTPSKLEGESASSGRQEEYQNIVLQKEFYHFSPEELRYHAYRTGKKQVPSAVVAASTVVTPPVVPPGGRVPAPNVWTTVVSRDGSTSETMQSISCNPAYSAHSFEELRVAYMLMGREATSDEVKQANHLVRLTV